MNENPPECPSTARCPAQTRPRWQMVLRSIAGTSSNDKSARPLAGPRRSTVSRRKDIRRPVLSWEFLPLVANALRDQWLTPCHELATLAPIMGRSSYLEPGVCRRSSLFCCRRSTREGAPTCEDGNRWQGRVVGRMPSPSALAKRPRVTRRANGRK
jgi:hypothetical protein